MRFNLKQLSLSVGIFHALVFLAWWGWVMLFPAAELHQQLLLEMMPGATWPMGILFMGLICSFVCGVLCGGIFGFIFNLFAPKK
jgi:hypothetical protein